MDGAVGVETTVLPEATRAGIRSVMRRLAGDSGPDRVLAELEKQGVSKSQYDAAVKRGESVPNAVAEVLALIAASDVQGPAVDSTSDMAREVGWSPELAPEIEVFGSTLDDASTPMVEDFDTLEHGVLAWHVKYLWPAVGVGFIAGPSMSGKSFWMIDALGRVCRGDPVLGRRSRPTGVVYLAAEGANGVRKRIVALRSRIGALNGRFKFYGGQTDLTDEDKLIELRQTLDFARAELEAAGHTLGIVVVDTLSAAAPGLDENTSSAMGAVLGQLQGLAADLSCLVLVVAHTGKDEARGIRGWSGQLASADAVITLKEPNGELRVGTVTKVKDGPSGDRFAFALEEVELGVDDDGDPITTCVCVDRDVPEATSLSVRPITKAGGTANLIMRAFSRVLEEQPHPVHAPGANGAKGIRVEDLREAAYRIGVGPHAPEIPADADEVERRRLKRSWGRQRSADFRRGFDHLLGMRKLRVEGDLVWEIDAKGPIR